jgi:hypothetical protein
LSMWAPASEDSAAAASFVLQGLQLRRGEGSFGARRSAASVGARDGGKAVQSSPSHSACPACDSASPHQRPLRAASLPESTSLGTRRLGSNRERVQLRPDSVRKRGPEPRSVDGAAGLRAPFPFESSDGPSPRSGTISTRPLVGSASKRTRSFPCISRTAEFPKGCLAQSSFHGWRSAPIVRETMPTPFLPVERSGPSSGEPG